jgi:hypothetical protein
VNCLSGWCFAQVPDEQDAATELFGKARQSIHDGARFIGAVRIHLGAQVGLYRIDDHESRLALLQRVPQEPDIGEPNAAPFGFLTIADDRTPKNMKSARITSKGIESRSHHVLWTVFNTEIEHIRRIAPFACVRHSSRRYRRRNRESDVRLTCPRITRKHSQHAVSQVGLPEPIDFLRFYLRKRENLSASRQQGWLVRQEITV